MVNSTAVCNLASLSLPKYIRYIDGQPDFDYDTLYKITKTIVRNIDNIIDINYYPIDEAKTNNIDYRPMGIGIQGLADVFAMFKAPWGSPVADTLNRYISECIYYAAVEASHELALEKGSYSAFEGSPYSKGILQYHLWNEKPKSVRWDWKALEEKVKRGMRNSLLIALMPTASSSQILGNNEAFEAFTSNLYSRSTLAGDFIILNKHLARDLKELGLWNRELVNKIIENDGSVQDIDEIPDDLKKVYKTVWEIKQNIIIKYAAIRAPFVDQTQSMNIFFDHPTNKLLSSLHMASWKAGLKTGSYYIRSKPSRNAVKFSILKEKKGKEYVKDGKKMVCTEDICTMCSS
jgi:ribonucleoside-diphosphate reductase alpha chain